MRIEEIQVNSSCEDPISKFAHWFNESPPQVATHASNELQFVYAPETNFTEEAFGLQTVDGELVSIIVVEHSRMGACQIMQTCTAPHWRNRGCIRYLINQITKKYGRLYSDNDQTPEAQDMWERLIKYPSGSMEIGIYDPVTGEEQKATLSNVHTAYANEKVLFVNRPPRALDESSHPNNIAHMKFKTTRDYESLWYFVAWENNP